MDGEHCCKNISIREMCFSVARSARSSQQAWRLMAPDLPPDTPTIYTVYQPTPAASLLLSPSHSSSVSSHPRRSLSARSHSSRPATAQVPLLFVVSLLLHRQLSQETDSLVRQQVTPSWSSAPYARSISSIAAATTLLVAATTVVPRTRASTPVPHTFIRWAPQLRQLVLPPDSSIPM